MAGDVAPHAGAWVETLCLTLHIRVDPSLPMRERGLKHSMNSEPMPLCTSLPMRERGLKLYKQKEILKQMTSLPMRERGLKLVE